VRIGPASITPVWEFSSEWTDVAGDGAFGIGPLDAIRSIDRTNLFGAGLV